MKWQSSKEDITNGFDDAGRLTSRTYQRLGKGINYEYDPSGRRSAMIDAEGGRTAYRYDKAGRIANITDPDGNFASYSYDATGRRVGVTYSNGTSTAYAYDKGGRVLGIITAGPGGTILSSYQYTYDKVGNRLSVKETGNKSTTYSYDKLYRLTAYDETRPDAAKGSFTYDAVGNRTSLLLAKKYLPDDSRTFKYAYNEGNQLLNIKQKGRQAPIETVFQYDKNGSRTTQAVTQGKSTATTSYSYDYQNMLSKVTTPDGNTVTIDNLTDGFNRLAKSTSAGTTRFLHDGMSVLAEYDSAGRETARYTLGPGTDEIIARKDDSGTYFYHYDGLGSVTAITDSQGKVVATYDYEPFGRQKAASTATVSTPYTFTGREWDKETGLYYYRARYYDPMEGRFISKDPIGFAGGVNLYSYVSNNPINKIDPYGLSERDVIKIVTESINFTRYLTDTGQRRDPGVINNLAITCRTLGLTSNEYNGCGGQAEALIAHLNDWQRSAGLDDKWTFEQSFRPVHYNVKAKSSNKCDQELTLDPWRNTYRGN